MQPEKMPESEEVLASWFRDIVLATPGADHLNEDIAKLPISGWMQELHRVRLNVEQFVQELQHANAYHEGQHLAMMVEPAAQTSTLQFQPEAILDTACVVTLHGDEWGAEMEKMLWDTYGLAPRTEATQYEITGVGGIPLKATTLKVWPVGLFGHAGEVRSIELPHSGVPLLLSRQAQEYLGVIIDTARRLVDVERLGVRQELLQVTSKGHYAIDLLAFPPEGHPWQYEQATPASLEDSGEMAVCQSTVPGKGARGVGD